MKKAFIQAQAAFESGEIPIGAVIVSSGRIISSAHNQVELLKDVTAHAEILAITAASGCFGSKYLKRCTLYVTLKPCPMCLGALDLSQIERVVYAADSTVYDNSCYNPKDFLHPKIIFEQGPMEKEASDLIRQFFLEKRKGV